MINPNKALVFTMFLLMTNCLFSQDEGDFRLSAFGENLDINGHQYIGGGLECQYFISKSLSLNYRYGYGVNENGEYILHFPALLGGVLISDDLYGLLLISVLTPEGVGYHLHPRDWLEAEIFIHPLSCDYNIRKNDAYSITGSLGLRVFIKPNDIISLSAYSGIKTVYGDGTVGSFTGFSIGFNLE